MGLIHKYRDSFLYEWAAGCADKPVDYLVLIGLDKIDCAHLFRHRNALETGVPIRLPTGVPWTGSIGRRCGVLDIASWNLTYPQYRVERVPEPPEPR